MPISVDNLINTIESKNGFPLDDPQKDAIRHGQGPLWVIAGPGTGKTEVLVVRCLKLMCCDNVDPRSIMVTTFTEKASRSLEDRISEAMLYLATQYPQVADVDTSRLRIGTLHSLCNEIMQEYRYVAYQNLRLLDDLESKMLIRHRVSSNVRQNQKYLLRQFQYLFDRRRRNNPNLWDWTIALQTLLNHIIDYRIDISALYAEGGPWAEIANINQLYNQVLQNTHSCDFSRLQLYFLEFLNSPQGQVFLNGDGSPQRPPLLHILVDEYQDTNPIQEEIYFTLANHEPYNLTVVGDDDQALYRFRGGTVECMIGFGDKCQSKWNISPRMISLVHNHRSDDQIVNWCNIYINSFQNYQQARIHGKPPLQPASGRNGSYPVVSIIREGRIADLAASFADTVKGLIDNRIIQDYNQCVLLLRSTRDTQNNAGRYIEALNARNIPVYNPRAKAFLEQPEVQEVLGCFVRILDPNLQVLRSVTQPSVVDMVLGWVDACQNLLQNYPQLEAYILKSQHEIQRKAPNTRITPAAPTILYRILAHEPFIVYQNNPMQDLRLSKLTRLLEAFCSQHGRALFVDDQQQGLISQRWLNAFYYILCGYLEAQGMDDDDDEETVCPPGMLPIMTIHQSKGLEFDFVFVGSLGTAISLGNPHRLEEDFKKYRITQPAVVHSPDDAALHDEIRLHFVAYSRAKYALVLLATENQLRKRGTASFGGQGGSWLRQNLRRL